MKLAIFPKKSKIIGQLHLSILVITTPLCTGLLSLISMITTTETII